ncbi:hypothetical protein K1T71_011182 [Dendrolimus kikuchii]|uniref:Uncharacterized protein n=1 Tax=Dendrolimus kikuchii TaxID=765133 RepID=A0ACC1CNA3_9NEOP|nr:hypothetical protein K1T71_011182 [Dendrolimus kikuchii]
MEILCALIHRHVLLLNGVRTVLKISSRSAVDLVHKIHGKNPNDSEPPVIVIHGLLGSKKNWESMCKRIALKANKSVIAVDVRNHGDSPSHSSHTYPDLASDISQLMSKLFLKKANIIGHSMGGRTAMVHALTEPEKVVSLVIVDISPIYRTGHLHEFISKLLDVMKTIDFNEVNNSNEARALAKDKIMASKLIENEESINFILMNIGKKSNNSFGWMCNINVLKEYFPVIASFPSEMTGKTYSGPALFVRGGNSTYLPPEDIVRIRDFFPKAEMIQVPNVGHNVHAEDAATFLDIVHIQIVKTGRAIEDPFDTNEETCDVSLLGQFTCTQDEEEEQGEEETEVLEYYESHGYISR